MPNLTEALKYAQQNPDSPFAAELRRRIESGVLNKELQAEGYNLSSFETEQPPVVEQKQKGLIQKLGEGISNLTGFGGASKSLAGAGAVLEQPSVTRRVTNSVGSVDSLIAEAKKLPQGDPRRRQLLEQANQVASGASQLADSSLKDLESAPTSTQAAGSFGKLGLNAATFGSSGIATGLAGRSVELGITGAAFKALENLESSKPLTKGVLTSGLLAGSLPVVGKGLSATKGALSRGGQKIQESLIKPSKADIEDGFSIANLNKYNLGGSLQSTLQKTESKITELSKQLATKIRSTDAAVDLNDLAKVTAKRILSDKSKIFGDVTSVRRVLQNLASEIEEQTANGLVSLPEAQVIKQAAGKKGAWVYGFADPDSKAVEKVYNEFYRVLKEEIEEKAPAGVKEINKQLSELIPISNAVIRRIPVAQRNNALGLSDIISGGFAIGNPAAIGLFVANRLSKSGSFGRYLASFENKKPITNIGKRVFGK